MKVEGKGEGERGKEERRGRREAHTEPTRVQLCLYWPGFYSEDAQHCLKTEDLRIRRSQAGLKPKDGLQI